MNLLNTIQQLCQRAIDSLSVDCIAEVTPATNAKFGHYQCNSAMKLTKLLGKPPREIAALLKQNLLVAGEDIFSEIEIAGPGFLNFIIKKKVIVENINIMRGSANLGIATVSSPKKVVIDFSSPNTAKEMHVGHLRSTIIGDSIARILEFLGHKVIRLNHIGDWGTQFGMLISYINNNHPANTLAELVTSYKAAKQQFDNDPDFKRQAQLAVVALQQGDPKIKQAWQQICKISSVAYQEVYDLLDINIIERGESFYSDMLPEVVTLLKKQQILEESNGAQCVFLEGFVNRDGDPLPLIIQKQDGGYNYATTDFAALQHRIQQEQANWLIYVTDSGQSQHFAMVFAAASKASVLDRNEVRVDHVPFGLVLREDGKKFQTRDGSTTRLIDLINTAILKSKEILTTKSPELSKNELQHASEVLGINAIKYADLSGNRIHDYKFSFDRMLQFEGNTAAFLLYAYVRVNGIKNKVENFDANAKLILTNDAEIELGLHIIRFPEALAAISNDLLPNRLADYLYKLAEKFHSFFHECRVIGAPEQDSRLILCDITAKVIKQGLALLGLRTLEHM